MNCPDDIADILIEIIYTACLSIRAAGYEGDSKYCALEASHIHNLPGLLRNFDENKLRYYWEITRLSYIEQMREQREADTGAYKALWNRLKPHVK